jgi:hypothetical protein
MLAIPTVIFAVECFSDAAGTEKHVYSRWNEIQQLLPRDQPIWTKCSTNDITRCKEGVAVTARANFQAIGWLAVTMASLGCINGMLSFALRNWHRRFAQHQRDQSLLSGGGIPSTRGGDSENGGGSKNGAPWTPNRQRPPSGYGTAGGGGNNIGGGNVGIGIHSPQDDANTYRIGFENSQSDAPPDETPKRQPMAQENASPRPNRLVRKGDIRWSFVSARGLGVSMKTCCGNFMSPSRTLRRLLTWTKTNPFKAFGVLLVVGTGIATGIAVFTFFIISRSQCALAASNFAESGGLTNYSSVSQKFSMPVPYGCMCESTLTNADTWHPLDGNGSCAKYPPITTMPPFYPTCYEIPRVQHIRVANEFTYGSVSIRTVNSTLHPNITASLTLLGLDTDLKEQWLAAMAAADWFAYNASSGVLSVNLLPPESEAFDAARWAASCASASIVLDIPMSLPKVKVYTVNQTSDKVQYSEELPFFVCISRQDQSVVPAVTGCIDVEVSATSVSVSMDSESALAINSLGKNGSSTQLFTDLLEEFPFGDIDVDAVYGNVLIENVFGTGKVDLSTQMGNIVMRNSFAKNLFMAAGSGSVEAVDIAAFAKILNIAEALNPKSTAKLVPSDFGNIHMQSNTGDTLVTGIFA